ncbi:putative bifunctional diguanylate cyclase/phosphodiesterase [Novosphingobium naphthalenivorans]|uniref:putative bifunctional diguanylate cyclase/phosphodiesterase n=1 Tax=Novosphingobium naphthalenivorans TaxID=273168 RepID=UPI000A41B6AE|nr:EAL domain-containing protein [Novosphingobium naphthalenivorans]
MKASFAGNVAAADEECENARQFDVVALGIVTAAILMFVATGSQVGPLVVNSLLNQGVGPDNLILNAFLLNIAIIIFGWSRYRQLCEEIQLRKAAEKQARHMAETDPLTGFLNRRSFNQCVDRLIEKADNQGQLVVLVMVDLDNFKQVNDFNGHNAGDLLLRECARRIASALPKQSLLGRIGGDEFAAAFAFDRNRDDTIEQIASGLIETIGQSAQINAISIEITASMGLARSDAPGVDGERPDAHAMLEMADIAMYHAKRQGRNGYFWFEGMMADEMRFRTELEQGIRQGIAKGEFVPFYEQQVDLQTGELTGFEMLARWDSPQFGIVSPEVFIPIAEEIGAISDLSESVIRQALIDAKTWNARLTLAVNVSPLQLRDPWFAQKLLRLLVDANFPPHRLEIEITESCLHQNIAQARSLITSLKNQGIKISLDDFGTGYSSLAQLRSLPFDRIKIDRSFVTSLIENKDNAAIVHAIAMLGKGLHLPVTVEGIETGEVLNHLLQYGQIKGQGYFYGRPRPAGELAEWLNDPQRAGMAVSVTGAEPLLFRAAADAAMSASTVEPAEMPGKRAHGA